MTRLDGPLTIVHCLRAPVGGLFRHVCDLVRGQNTAGHRVGVVCDARSSDGLTEQKLDALSKHCALGIERVAMHRQIAPGDLVAAFKVRAWCGRAGAHIVHGHGAKGGAFARFAALGTSACAVYTPHGGSLHYSPRSPGGFVFLKLEKALSRATDGLIFESDYGRRTYAEKVGAPHCDVRVIHNGLAEAEFTAVRPAPDAADFLYVGELRDLKGVDVLLDALKCLNETRPTSAVIVGDGVDEARYRDLAAAYGIADKVSFPGAMPAGDAFRLGRTLIVPSRAESFPYIVLEAVAAKRPLIATNVGGIPEIFGTEWAHALIPPGDANTLCAAMRDALADASSLTARTRALQKRAKTEFSLDAMLSGVTAFYRQCLEKTGVSMAQAGRTAPAE